MEESVISSWYQIIFTWNNLETNHFNGKQFLIEYHHILLCVFKKHYQSLYTKLDESLFKTLSLLKLINT